MIDTARVTDHRKLRFDTPEQMRAEVDRIVAAERAGTLRRAGNWSAGQCFGHLATWIDFAYDGYPIRPPWFIKLVVRAMKNRFLRGSLPMGLKIRKVEGGTLGIEPLLLDAGLDKFNAAWDRLLAAPPSNPNIVLGPLTHQEWKQMHLRHAELHLGFLHPGPSAG